jgi:hypothetical protein
MTKKLNNIPQHKNVGITPDTPETGYNKIYAKDDGIWYGLDELGVETPLGASAISVDGITITGDGTPGDPLATAFDIPPYWLEYNETDLTIWNNGKGNISSNISYGSSALKSNTTGSRNNAIGVYALSGNTTGSNNIALGYDALGSNISGVDNTAIGNLALESSTGNYNTAVGSQALLSNTADNNLIQAV